MQVFRQYNKVVGMADSVLLRELGAHKRDSFPLRQLVMSERRNAQLFASVSTVNEKNYKQVQLS